MNANGVLTTHEELERAGTFEHEKRKAEGIYRLRLKCRGWYKKPNRMRLVCYFEELDDPEEKWQLFCFHHKVEGKQIYNPKRSKISIFRGCKTAQSGM